LTKNRTELSGNLKLKVHTAFCIVSIVSTYMRAYIDLTSLKWLKNRSFYSKYNLYRIYVDMINNVNSKIQSMNEMEWNYIIYIVAEKK